MVYATVKDALKATKKFHKTYGSKDSTYICKPYAFRKNYVIVEVWQKASCGVKYFSTLV